MPISPRFAPATSPYPLPDGVAVETGYLTVPEARDSASGGPNERTIRLFVAIVRATALERQPDPIVFLNGGPGGNIGPLLGRLDQPIVRDAFLGTRDFVLFDQRGTGYSEPALLCEELDCEMAQALLDGLQGDERARRYVEVALTCRERLVAEGINLRAFNTAETAADLEDLRVALGYPRLNLFGISYGTRPALAAMRDFPRAIRSVVLDSTVPMQVSQYAEGIANTAASFDLLFERVAADPAANAAYPDLGERFYALIDQLNAEPASVAIEHPTSGGAVDVPVTGELLAGIASNVFYSSAEIPSLPKLIANWLDGDFSHVAEVARDVLKPSERRGGARGLYYCVNCCDDKGGSEIVRAAIDAQRAIHPRMAQLPLMEWHLGEQIVDLCAAWGAREPGPDEYAPVTSDIPTLILAGEYDQNTPARFGRLAGETLSRGYYVEQPGGGHGVIGSGACAARIIRAFYDDPWTRPDDACMRVMPGPRWVLPGE
jgi:pimeloyl-ACP methyl ester carboxylesterase